MQKLTDQGRSKLPARVRNRIGSKLERAAKLLEEAVDLAKENGWPDAFGFVDGGGGGRVGLFVIHSFKVRLEQNGTPPADLHVASPLSPDGWDCGGW